tara:strand:- start:254 stop:460 length:207 start_codon:yes stop_codon:yes gene_type:complete
MSSITTVLKLKNAKLEAQLAEANAATMAMDSRIQQLEKQLRALGHDVTEPPLKSKSTLVRLPALQRSS